MTAISPWIGGDPPMCRQYEIERELGAGSYGKVYSVLTPQKERKAMKAIPLPSDALRRGGLDSHQVMELLALTRFAKHPNLLPVEDVFFNCGDDDDGSDQSQRPQTLFFVMEFAPGGDLIDWMNKLEVEEAQTLDALRQFGYILRDVLEGLQHLHVQNLAHLDIKPENILLTAPTPTATATAGPTFTRAKLTDYGLVHWNGTILGLRGSRGYIAPELFQYGQNVARADGRPADIWSIGALIVLFLFAYHVYVWEGERPRQEEEDEQPERNSDEDGDSDGDGKEQKERFLVLLPNFKDNLTGELNWSAIEEQIRQDSPIPDVRQAVDQNSKVAAGLAKSLWELAKSCLRLRPEQRPDASQLLVHDFFARLEAATVCLSPNELESLQPQWWSPKEEKKFWEGVFTLAKDVRERYNLPQQSKGSATTSTSIAPFKDGMWRAIIRIARQTRAHRQWDVIALAMWIGVRYLSRTLGDPSQSQDELDQVAIVSLQLAYEQIYQQSVLIGALPDDAQARRFLRLQFAIVSALGFDAFVDTRWYTQADDLLWLQHVWCVEELLSPEQQQQPPQSPPLLLDVAEPSRRASWSPVQTLHINS